MGGLAAALAFTWFGMVIAISFLETPLKFRAPGITVPLGLGIGRLVFKALNIAESVLAVLLLAALATGHVDGRGWIPAVLATVCLLAQMAVLRPALDRRAAVVITGGEVAPSRLHLGYVALEVIKVVALVVAGALSLA
ncbi:hypothetical protein [Actinoallomurus acaciae]|uniref:Transmembrane protein n=1 Tax=Actinoallomurus acaciae TaxID=502577 RepID=A0ABV5Y706_9ACTN